MGKASRAKGLRRERAIVDIHAKCGIPAERVPLSGGHTLYTQYANNMAYAILNTVMDGEDLTEDALNNIIDNCGGDVLSGGSYDAFGSVEDILRILSGENVIEVLSNLHFDNKDLNFPSLCMSLFFSEKNSCIPSSMNLAK